MAGDVYHCGGPDHRRVWVEMRRDPAPCPRSSLREHTLTRKIPHPGPPVPGPSVPAPPATGAIAPCPPAETLTFAEHLEKLNREALRVVESLPPDEPVNPDPQRTSRPIAPRLADTSPLPQTALERKIRLTYRLELPLRLGRVIDVLV